MTKILVNEVQMAYIEEIRKLKKQVTELKSQNSALKEACGLALSMILSGEHINPKAEKIFEQALKGGE